MKALVLFINLKFSGTRYILYKPNLECRSHEVCFIKKNCMTLSLIFFSNVLSFHVSLKALHC